MKRKVIQIANSTQLISIPREWSKQFNIKKGDELDLDVNGGSILVRTENDQNLKSNNIEVNIDELDRSSIIYVLRALYIKGYNEIKLNFNKPTTYHYRLGETKNIIPVIHHELNRMVGMEIMQQKGNFCILKHISSSDIKEFDNILRRIFILLIDASHDLINGLKNKDWILVNSLEEKHDTITKFISYCLRMLNKRGYPDHRQTNLLYHIIASFDKLIDVYKNCSREALKFKQPIKNETYSILQEIQNYLEFYYDLFYKYSFTKVNNISKNKEVIRNKINDLMNKLPKYDLLILGNFKQVLEILLDLTVAKTALEY